MKKEFIKKWSTWWILEKQKEELTFAFEKELDVVIKIAINEYLSNLPNEEDSFNSKMG